MYEQVNVGKILNNKYYHFSVICGVYEHTIDDESIFNISTAFLW